MPSSDVPRRPIRVASAPRGHYQRRVVMTAVKNQSSMSLAPPPSSPIVHVAEVPSAASLLNTLQSPRIACPDSVISAWPSSSGSKLHDTLLGILLKPQSPEGTASDTADRIVQSLRVLADHMQSYKDIFEIISSLVYSIAKDVGDLSEKLFRESTGYETQLADKETEYRLANIDMTNEIRILKRQISDGQLQMESVRADREQLNQRAAQLENDRLAALKREEDVAAARRMQDAMFAQFAMRNRALEEEVVSSSKLAQDNKQKADELTGTCQRYAQRVYRLEQSAIDATRQTDRVITKLSDALEQSQTDNKRMSRLNLSLRDLKRNVEEELLAVRSKLELATNQMTEYEAVHTPRPSFRSDSQQLSSSNEKVNFLYEQLDKLRKDYADLSLYCEQLQRSHSVSEFITQSRVNSAMSGGAGCTFLPIECPSIHPVSNRFSVKPMPFQFNEPLPVFFMSSTPVHCRSWSLPDTIRRCKEMLDVYATLASRTSKRLELHCAFSVHLLDTISASLQAQGEPSEDSKVPLQVSEQCYSLLFNLNTWSANPLIRTCRCILNESVGVWVWGSQNRFIDACTAFLSRLGATNFSNLFESVRDFLLAEGFGIDVVDAIRRPLGRSFIPEKLLASARKSKVPVSEDAIIIRVEDPRGGGPAAPSLASPQAPETSFVSALRLIYLRRLMVFYETFDGELKKRVTIDDGNVGNAPTMKKYPPQHPSSLGNTLSGTSRFAKMDTFANRQNYLSEEQALACLRGSCPGLETATSEEFIKECFKQCRQQLKLEAQRLLDGATVEYRGPSQGMAFHQIFLPGWTSHYFHHQYMEYPAMRHAGASDLLPSLDRPSRLSIKDSTKSFSSKQKKIDSGAQILPSTHVEKSDVAHVMNSDGGDVPLILFLRMYRKVPFVPPPQEVD